MHYLTFTGKMQLVFKLHLLDNFLIYLASFTKVKCFLIRVPIILYSIPYIIHNVFKHLFSSALPFFPLYHSFTY